MAMSKKLNRERGLEGKGCICYPNLALRENQGSINSPVLFFFFFLKKKTVYKMLTRCFSQQNLACLKKNWL